MSRIEIDVKIFAQTDDDFLLLINNLKVSSPTHSLLLLVETLVM